MSSGWAKQTGKPTNAKKTPSFDLKYYQNLYSKPRDNVAKARLAFVGKENTLKTGLAVARCRANIGADKTIVVIDIDNSAGATIAHNYADDKNIQIIPIYDELDESLFLENGSTNWTALVDKVGWFAKCIATDENVGAVILDGCSTLLKWCEFAMNDVLMNRSRNPVNVDDGDRFNQAEWRTRNKLFKQTLTRYHLLPFDIVCFTFHLKDVKEFMDIGDGKKGLMKIGELPEWENGSKRLFNQQIFLARYSKAGDPAAGVKKDSSLDEGEWVIRAEIQEMKGKHQEYLGSTHDVLKIKGGKVKWLDLPFLVWAEEDGSS
tara:strand:+ start:4923 stop:5879 length:957 start_codon:yes stop_codon:yes gene_type:complete